MPITSYKGYATEQWHILSYCSMMHHVPCARGSRQQAPQRVQPLKGHFFNRVIDSVYVLLELEQEPGNQDYYAPVPTQYIDRVPLYSPHATGQRSTICPSSLGEAPHPSHRILGCCMRHIRTRSDSCSRRERPGRTGLLKRAHLTKVIPR
eukprot:scaffold625_cov420-Prasinococcus_capsulatus_cf.AAC.37